MSVGWRPGPIVRWATPNNRYGVSKSSVRRQTVDVETVKRILKRHIFIAGHDASCYCSRTRNPTLSRQQTRLCVNNDDQ